MNNDFIKKMKRNVTSILKLNYCSILMIGNIFQISELNANTAEKQIFCSVKHFMLHIILANQKQNY